MYPEQGVRGRPRRARGLVFAAWVVVGLTIFSGAVSATSGIGLVASPLTSAPSLGSPAAAGPAGPALAPAALASPAHSPSSPGAGAGASPHAKAPLALTVSPSTGNVSTPVTFTASGFADASAFTLIYVDSSGKNSTACSGTTSSTGTYSCSLEMPPLSAGAHLFTATDAKAHKATATFTVAPQLILSPSSGLAGTPVAVQGTGFGAKVTGPVGTTKVKIVHFTVTLSWVDGTICSGVKMSASGGFNCTLSSPPLVPGGHQKFSAVDNASNKATATFDVLTGLTVGPSSGEDGTNVTFIGTGYGALTTVYVSWSVGRACKTETPGTGEFTCGYTIPADTPGGTYLFSANDSSGHVASAPFTITYVEATPANGPVGTHISITAGGFAADSPLTISWDSTVACPTNSTNAYGSLTCTFIVPSDPAGVHLLTATDSAGNKAVGQFVVDPALTLDPAYGPAGSVVSFNGSGFAAHSPVAVTWLAGNACSATTGATGAFNCTYQVPADTTGNAYTFTATDAADDVGTGTFVVTYVSLTPTTVPVAGNFSISGLGFAPGASFTVTSGSLSLCSGTVTATGALACPKVFKIPYLTAGPHPVVAEDTSPAMNRATTEFTVVPTLTIKPDDGPVGTPILFNGTGFAADSSVAITWTGGTLCSVETTALGAFECGPADMPAAPYGTYTLTATDGSSDTAVASFALGPSLSVTPGSATVGSPVAFTAEGFSPATAISVEWSGGLACSGTTNSIGTYSCSYSLPPTPGGLYYFTAADADSRSAIANLTIEALLSVNPSTGSNGTLVTFQGSGFEAQKTITVSWSIGEACVTTSTATGEFTCSYSIPPAAGGVYTFSATDGKYTATASFSVVSALVATPGRGPVGTVVAFSGAGFAKSETVTVSWDGGKTACRTTSLPTGGFGCSFTVPATTPGTKQFTATDPAGDSASVDFTVVPSLLPSPASGPVGTLVTFNGSGFAAGAAVSVTSGTLAACDATTNASGSFQCVLTIPTTTFGAHEFTATDTVNRAFANFTVLAHLAASPSSGLIGTTVTFTGTGYAAIVGVTVSWAEGSACSNTTSAAGQFSCKYTIPTGTPGGVYPFTGADGTGDTAQATFTVSTSLVDSPSHGMDNTSVTFSGTGFAAGSTVTVSWSGGTACTSTATGGGTFSCAYEIPAHTPGGSYTFTAKDTSGDSASTTFLVTYLTASPPGGLAGSSVSLSAGGFSAVTAFSITFSGTGTTVCSGMTTATGTYSCSVNIPVYVGPGTYSFSGTDGTLKASTPFTVFGTPVASTPTPTRPAGDVGQSVTFTTVASGGSGVYPTYSWTESEPGLGCTLDNAASIVCVPTGVGNYTVTVVVTDSAGDAAAPATSANYAVSLAPTVSTPTENVSVSDANQSVTFSEAASGGAGALSYAWHGLPTGCAGTTATVKCTPTVADLGGSVTVTVTDANGYAVTSGALGINVYPDPTVTTPLSSRTADSADVGQSVTFSVTASGGDGTLSYVWAGLPTGCGTSSDRVTCTWTSAVGATSINVTVTDANHFRVVSGSLAFRVDSDPTVTTPTASRSSVDVGQLVTFSTTASGGSGGFLYEWANLPTGCTGTAASVACRPTAPGTGLSITVTVSDSNGFRVTSDVLAFSAYADPSAAAPLVSTPTADIGQTVTFSANVSGGAPPISYVWRGLPAGCAGTTVQIVCVVENASEVGGYTISYVALDANGLNSTSPAISFHLDLPPSVMTPVASRPSADVGQSVTFSVTATGGAAPLAYTWIGLPEGCSGSTNVVICAPTAPMSTSDIEVNVTDANGFTVTSGVLVFTVYAPPLAGTPTASVPSADVGQSVTFATVISNGSGGFLYTWSGLPAGCSGSTATIVCASLSAADPYSVTVTVQDSNGISNTSAALNFTVYPDPTVSTPVASAPGIDVGQTVTFSATGGGGSGTLSWAWSGLPTGCTGTTTGTVSCTPTAALSASSITATVTDPNGFSVTSSALVYTVDAALTVTVKVSPSSLLEGAAVTFTASVSGGSGGFVYAWSGLPAGCSGTGASITCKPSSSGSYSVGVSVTDSNHATAKATGSVSVQSAFLGLPSAEGIALLAVGILAAIVLVGLLAVLLVRRRRRAQSAPMPWSPSPTAPPPAAAAPAASAPPTTWTPPASEPSTSDEPAAWEMPPAEGSGDESGGSSGGQ